MVSIHVEADVHLHRTVQAIRAAGAKAGVVLNPRRPCPRWRRSFPAVDYVLLMSVNPGFGGQTLIPACWGRSVGCGSGSTSSVFLRIEIDGGVDVDNWRRWPRPAWT